MVMVLLGAASAARAGTGDKPLKWQGDFGWSMVEGDGGDVFEDGWTFGFGAVWTPTPDWPVDLRFDLTWDIWDVNTGNVPNLDVRVDDGDADQWSLRGGAQWESKGDRARFVGGAGIGVYYLHADVTEEVIGTGYICDPWWGWCYPGLVVGDLIVADESTTKFGYYASAGVIFPLRNQVDLFVEAQYHWVQTKTTWKTLPIVFGARW